MSEIYDAAIEAGGIVNFSNKVNFGFTPPPLSEAGRGGIGRFTGTIAGSMSVADDGSYTVHAELTFDVGKFTWKPDDNRGWVNALITLGASRINNFGTARSKPYSFGNPFTPISTRTYVFSARGRGPR